MLKKIEPKAAILCVFCLFFTALLFAGDGQIDIRPTGTTSFSISTPGSYVLTDNVTMTADTDCIQIAASDVTLDLNGHTITGNGSNSYGIYGPGANRIHIFNGTIRNFGSLGIYLSDECRIERVVLKSNGGHGMEIGLKSHVIGVKSVSNSGFGIKTSDNSIIDSCIASSNSGGTGIEAGENCTIRNCVCSENSILSGSENVNVYGIKADMACTIINNSCHKNENQSTHAAAQAYGISCDDNCVVKDNTCHQNKSFSGNFCFGINTGSVSTIVENSCSFNTTSADNADSVGISCGLGSVIKNNTCNQNNASGTTNATAQGIGINTPGCLIRGNNCASNNASANSYGILIKGDHNRLENNLCTSHSSGTGYGIYLTDQADDCVVVGNTTSNNNTNGINLGGGDHWCAENMTTDGIINTTGATMGTGDRANVAY